MLQVDGKALYSWRGPLLVGVRTPQGNALFRIPSQAIAGTSLGAVEGVSGLPSLLLEKVYLSWVAN